MNYKKFFFYWFPAAFYAALIFILSSMPSLACLNIFPYCDKFMHLVEYGLFGFLVFRALHATFEEKSVYHLRVIAVVICLAYGLSDEIHQYFVATRECDLVDFMFDGIGGYIGQLLFRIRG